MSLRLHKAAHNTKGTNSLTILGHEGRNNGVIRTLATLQCIRMIFIKREVLGTVIKGNGSTRYNDTTAKATIVALNHADHITFGISGAEVNSAAVTRVTYNRLQCFIINQSTAVCGIALAQKLLGSNLHVGRLGNIFFSINEA